MSDSSTTVTSEGAIATILVALIAYTTTGIDDFCICVVYNGMAAHGELMTYQNVRLGFFFSFFLIMTISCVGLFFGAVIPGGYVQLLGFLPFLIGLNQMARMVYIRFIQKKKKEVKAAETDDNNNIDEVNPMNSKTAGLVEISSVMGSVLGDDTTTSSSNAETSTKTEQTTPTTTTSTDDKSTSNKGSSHPAEEEEDRKNEKAHGFFIRFFGNLLDPRTLEVAAVTFSTNIFYSCLYLPIIAVESRPCVGISIAVWFGCALTAYCLSRFFVDARSHIDKLHSVHKYSAPLILMGMGMYMMASSVITTAILNGQNSVKGGLPDNGSSGHRYLRF